MVVCNLDIVSISITPSEANSPLLVNPNAVLALAITREFFEAVTRWNAKIVESFCGVQDGQFIPCGAM